MVLNPRRLNVDAVPVKMFEVLPACVVSIGYASNAGAPARLAAFSAALIKAVETPRRRYPGRMKKHERDHTGTLSRA